MSTTSLGSVKKRASLGPNGVTFDAAGCLIVSLVAVSLISAGPREWIAGLVAALGALTTRSLPLTMVLGIAAIWLLRHYQ